MKRDKHVGQTGLNLDWVLLFLRGKTLKLFYRQMGEGKPLIILHGLFGMSDNWYTIAKKIAKRHTVYLLDQRNHGKSGHRSAFNYEVLVDDLREFIIDRNISTVKIIGHSMGGKVAMRYSLNYPEKIAKLVVVDIAPKKYKRPLFTTLLKQLQAIDLSKLKSRKEADQVLAEKIPQMAIRQFLLKNLDRDENLNFRWKINVESIYNNLDQILDNIGTNGTFNKNTLFVRGGNSDYVSDGDFNMIRSIFPQARIETIPRASHWVHSEAPDELCDLLRDFL